LFSTTIMVRSLSLTQQNTILSLLDSGNSDEATAKQVGVSPSAVSKACSKTCSALPKAIGGHYSKLSLANICHAQHLITSGKDENAFQVTKALSNIIDQPPFANTVYLHLQKSGIKVVVKTKCPIAHFNLAYTHKDWTIGNWKRVVWSDEIKINHLGSDGHKWAWKKTGEMVNNRLVQGTLKFGGGSLMI